MLAYKRIVIAEHERGLVLKDRSVERILEPGVYRLFDPLGRTRVEVYDVTDPGFEYAHFDVLMATRPALCERYFQVAEIGDHEVGLAYRKGVLVDVLAPSTQPVYWRGPVDTHLEVIDIQTEYEVSKERVAVLANLRDAKLQMKLAAYLHVTEVAEDSVGLLMVDGQLVRTLDAGVYAFWKLNRNIKVEQLDLRVQAMEVSGQEILTRDKVTLRINLSAAYQVSDPVKVRNAFQDWTDHLYRELQFGLRQAVGTRTLDTLLGEKGTLDKEVAAYVRERVAEHGIELSNVGVKDVILPGEMKEILNQVVEAEKVSQANVIKRREETAATRSLLNNAKLMEDNPTLLRLKELEVLEKVTEKVDRLTGFGGLDGVLKDTVKINV